ncbi:hypothetical protein FEM48_Zijuj08G0180600 [Ziziphus jujuba var. spinosa]|uniref:Uncharacterized protein n=1 Tax=Ziziphus jujuba var. spinosa TaxID=714518 RepID=A0A978V0J9_ZIZJJ|nr:hypothetical protein FEM48_Zijuj08G0180600 [Ziziphus jujuba var. spinosa]
MFVTPDWAGQDRIQSQSGVWKVKMEGGQFCPVDHFIPNEGDKSDPSGDWVTFVPPSSLRSISGHPLRSIVDLASPSPSKHLAGLDLIFRRKKLDFGGKLPFEAFLAVSLSSAAPSSISSICHHHLRNVDRYVPLQLDQKTVGSMTLPAARCGVTALRPTFGIVGRAGIVNFTMDVDMLAHFDEWQRWDRMMIMKAKINGLLNCDVPVYSEQ